MPIGNIIRYRVFPLCKSVEIKKIKDICLINTLHTLHTYLQISCLILNLLDTQAVF